MSDKIKKKLKIFGLNEISAEIYLFLLNKPPQTILEISRHLSIPRTSIYDNSEKLLEKGLVQKIIQQKTQLLQAYPIEILGEIVEDERKQLDTKETMYAELKELTASMVINPAKTQVRYYQGVSGFRQLMWNTLKAEDGIVGYSIFGRADIVGKAFYDKYVKEFRQRKLSDKVILNPRKESLSYIDTYVNQNKSQLEKSGLRLLPEEKLYISGDTSIYNNTFAVCWWKQGEIVGVEIENAELVRMQKSIFYLLWDIAEKYE
jgi:sugar-specific transcriptional regulator TrmB